MAFLFLKMNQEIEIWKDVRGYEGVYQVSNLGKIRSIDRLCVDVNGKNRRMKGREILQAINTVGYKKVTLSANGESVNFLVHRIVAEAFIENSQNKRTVNHIDGNKHNNNALNLEWMSHSENERHAMNIGIKVHKNSKPRRLNHEILAVSLSIKRDKETMTYQQLSKKYSMSFSSVWKALNR